MPYYITVHHWFIPNTSQKEHNYPVTVVIKLHNFLTKHHWSDVDIFKALLFLFLYTTSFPIFKVSITRSQWHHIHYKYFQEVRPWELYAYTSSGELELFYWHAIHFQDLISNTENIQCGTQAGVEPENTMI